MAIIPIKDFAKFGTITDGSPAGLPLEAFSMMKNVRCHNGVIERGPVCRMVSTLASNPRHIASYIDPNGTSRVFIQKHNGTVIEYGGSGIETDRTASGWTPSNSEAPITSTQLNGVLYLNRSDREPWFRALTAGGSFAKISSYSSGNGLATFPTGVRFRSLRECGGYLVGINTTTSGNNSPTMVKWSNRANAYQLPPLDWDTASTLSDAGENVLAEMRGELIDGAKLGQNLILYGSEETWLMEPTFNSAVFAWRRLHENGILNVNCVVERGGRHYVFGDRDIYMSDGNSVKSIAMGFVRDHIYNNMVTLEKGRAFAYHNEAQNSIYFGYVSADSRCTFPFGAPMFNVGVNQIAAYNYVSETWTFLDVPYINDMQTGVVSSGLTYASVGAITYEEIGGSYASQGDEKSVLLMVSNGWTHPTSSVAYPAAIRSFERYEGASTSTIDPIGTAPVYLEKTMIDLDELKAEKRQNKLVSSIYVQAELSTDSLPMVFTIGATDHPAGQVYWGEPQTYDHENMKLDHNIQGRFLAIKMEYADFKGFKFVGLDCDLVLLGRR